MNINLNSKVSSGNKKPAYWQCAVIGRLSSLFRQSFCPNKEKNEQMSPNNIVEKYLAEYDERFGFTVHNGIVNKEIYEETKSYYVFKCLATHYNLSTRL
jgi:hypothetical protein